MSIQAVAQVLTRVMGLDPQSIGLHAVSQVIRRRMQVTRVDDPTAYAAYLHRSPVELRALVEAIVIPETWFFRAPEAFSLLARRATGQWGPYTPDTPLRVASVGCAGGEEPYTIAMALMDAGIEPGAVRIDALDISRESLAKARRGIYRNSSFRGGQMEYRDRHFEPTGAGWAVHGQVKQAVTFHHGNILHLRNRLRTGAYHAVFCRNLLIYLDQASRHKIIGQLGELMWTGGIIFCGHAEANLFLKAGFEKIPCPHAFAFLRGNGTGNSARASKYPVPAAPERRGPAPGPATGTSPKRAPRNTRRPIPARESGAARAPSSPVDPGAALERIRTLANQGNLEEARSQGKLFLATMEASAEAYYLLGLVETSAGRHRTAADLLRKATYLDPGHGPALFQLALLSERQGDLHKAHLLRTRAARLATRRQADRG